MDTNSTMASLADCELTSPECNYVILMKQVLFSLTLIFDTVTLMIIILLQKYQSFSQRIFLNILIGNIGEAITCLSNDGHPTIGCAVAGYFVQVFGFVLFMWVCGLTVFLVSLLHVKKEKQIRERTYMLVCWTFPFLLAVLPFTTNDYGPAGVFCWIRGSKPWGDAWRFAVWWVPVFTSVQIIFVTFIVLHCQASRKNLVGVSHIYRRQHRHLVKNNLRPLTGYAFAFVIIHTLMIIDRVHTLVHPAHPVLRALHIISFTCYGSVLCSLFYIMNGKNEFTIAKFEAAIQHHRNVLTGNSLGRIVTFKLETPMPTVSEFVSRIHSLRIPNRNPAFEEDPTEAEPPNTRQVTFQQPVAGSLSVSQDEMILSSTSASGTTNYCKHSDQTSDDSEHNSLDLSELGKELEEPESKESFGFTRETNEENTKARTLRREDKIVINKPAIHHEYTMTDDTVLKIHVDEERCRWETWLDMETVETWTARLMLDLGSKPIIIIRDQDGVQFAINFTWRQIKSMCSSVQISVNSTINRIQLDQTTESADTDEKKLELQRSHYQSE